MTDEVKDPVDDQPPVEVDAEPVVEIAEEPDVDRELRRLSRRGFITAGIAAAAGLGAYEWLRTRPRIDGVEWPFRRVLETNERLAKAYFSRHRLNPTYSRSQISRPARINGGVGLNEDYDMASWRLNVEGSARGYGSGFVGVEAEFAVIGRQGVPPSLDLSLVARGRIVAEEVQIEGACGRGADGFDRSRQS